MRNLSKNTVINYQTKCKFVKKCNTTIPCINYGIESYYVKEHAGKPLENNLRNGVLVRVSVDKNGKAKVKGFQE